MIMEENKKEPWDDLADEIEEQLQEDLKQEIRKFSDMNHDPLKQNESGTEYRANDWLKQDNNRENPKRNTDQTDNPTDNLIYNPAINPSEKTSDNLLNKQAINPSDNWSDNPIENSLDNSSGNSAPENNDPLSSQSEVVNKTERSKKIRSFVTELLVYAVIIYACIFIIPNYVIQRTIVDGPSMEDTLHNGESLLVDKIVYKFEGLKRFDIIVFYPYGKESKDYYVKRIIGLPGETLQIKGSDIYINGKVLKENYGKDPITYGGIAEEPITLGEEEYFVMGDNREISFDSRYEEVGLVSRKNIGGRAVLRIWPIQKFGDID